MKRIRFGVRSALPFGLFPNAGIFVFRMSEDKSSHFLDAVDKMRLLLELSGNGKLAERIVCEVE